MSGRDFDYTDAVRLGNTTKNAKSAIAFNLGGTYGTEVVVASGVAGGDVKSVSEASESADDEDCVCAVESSVDVGHRDALSAEGAFNSHTKAIVMVGGYIVAAETIDYYINAMRYMSDGTLARGKLVGERVVRVECAAVECVVDKVDVFTSTELTTDPTEDGDTEDVCVVAEC